MVILTEVNRNANRYVSSEKIINLVIKFRNFILIYDDDYDYYEYHEYKKFKDHFIEYYYDNELDIISYFNYSIEFHRNDGPAQIFYYKNGEICVKEYYLNNKKYSYENYVLEIEKLV